MIEASFDRRSGWAAVTGAYQYDSGQRLVMRGLPSPDELTGEDDLLSGELPTVQAQFSYIGDSQSESRLALWDDWCGAWIAVIPDEYLTRHDDVAVHVSVYYGTDENGSRNKTMYEAVFCPISRPAPNDTVSDEQVAEWEAMATEITLALSSAESAAISAREKGTGAETAAKTALEAQKAAQTAQAEAEEAYRKLAAVQADRMKGAIVVSLPTGSTPTVSLAADGYVFGIPQGAKGPQGDPGANGPSDLEITFSNGALTITPREG